MCDYQSFLSVLYADKRDAKLRIICSERSQNPAMDKASWLTPATWQKLNEKCSIRSQILAFNFEITAPVYGRYSRRKLKSVFLRSCGGIYAGSRSRRDNRCNFSNPLFFLENALKTLLLILQVPLEGEDNGFRQKLRDYLNQLIVDRAERSYCLSIDTVYLQIGMLKPEEKLNYADLWLSKDTKTEKGWVTDDDCFSSASDEEGAGLAVGIGTSSIDY